ncbi:hypothetical protein, partial [Limnospira platensis]|uniref:hypothetical protein n=1 Tax=Limnospira platensis TaxID=118562 RepID=UPI00396C8EC3
ALGNGASGGYMLPLGDNICRSDAPYGLMCFGKWCVRMVRQVAICFLWVIIFAGLTHPTV